MGRALADKFGWKVGDVISLQSDIFPLTVRLTIRCIFKSKRPSDEMALHFNYKLLEEGVFYMKGRIGNFFVRVRRPGRRPQAHRADRPPFRGCGGDPPSARPRTPSSWSS